MLLFFHLVLLLCVSGCVHRPGRAGQQALSANSPPAQAAAAVPERGRAGAAAVGEQNQAASRLGEFPLVVTPEVSHWMRFFKTQGRSTFAQWLVRAETLKPALAPILDQAGVPRELMYLAMIESGFNSKASSTAKAIGPWQLMRGTAVGLGLQVNYWVDERRDPEKSTRAAALYIRDLYLQFDDWFLALAAYNAGPAKVQRAVRQGKTRDFWSLSKSRHLSLESGALVPKVLAAWILATNPADHGFAVPDGSAAILPTSTVPVERPIQLADLAQQLDVPLQRLEHWNPELLRGFTPPRSRSSRSKTGNYSLRLPPEEIVKFHAVKAQLAEVHISDVRMHRIRRGETLRKIARHYKVDVKKLLAFNPNLRSGSISVGQVLAIPIPEVRVVPEV